MTVFLPNAYLILENCRRLRDCSRNNLTLGLKTCVVVTGNQRSYFFKKSSFATVLFQLCMVSIATWIQCSWSVWACCDIETLSAGDHACWFDWLSKTLAGRDPRMQTDNASPHCMGKWFHRSGNSRKLVLVRSFCKIGLLRACDNMQILQSAWNPRNNFMDWDGLSNCDGAQM